MWRLCCTKGTGTGVGGVGGVGGVAGGTGKLYPGGGRAMLKFKVRNGKFRQRNVLKVGMCAGYGPGSKAAKYGENIYQFACVCFFQY